MSRFLFERLTPGYLGKKKTTGIKCSLSYCDLEATKYKGAGERLCEHHQSLLREYGGPARIDRPWTFHKKRTCDCCGHDPWQHPKVQKIDNELIRDRVAWGMLIVDHIETQRDGGSHQEGNVQTLCLDCNMIKSMLAGDMTPRNLYKDESQYKKVLRKLKPYYKKVFG